MTWTAEPHGDGIGIYSGRDNQHHGRRLFQISDGDMQLDLNLKFMLDAVNSYHSHRDAITALMAENARLREALERVCALGLSREAAGIARAALEAKP